MKETAETVNRLIESICGVLIGKEKEVRDVIVGLLARGHVLIEDIPGVGKTLLALATARSMGVRFRRIQFTSDTLPSDVIGVNVYDPKTSEFLFKQGPIFTEVLLADEINRTTPRTQSALLEAMAEGKVSVDGVTYGLSEPFFVSCDHESGGALRVFQTSRKPVGQVHAHRNAGLSGQGTRTRNTAERH